jgi:SAM-dependent methyltransferase
MDSLDQFVASGRARYGRRFILPADAGWFHYVHKRPFSSHSTSASGVRSTAAQVFDELHVHFDRLARKDDKKDPAVDIWAIAGSTVVNHQPGVFMAPMCSPLTRVTARPLRENLYWVTEKSDGLRVVVVSIMAMLPRWAREQGCSSPLGENLYDTAQLERGLAELLSDPGTRESSQLRLTFGVHTLKRSEFGGPRTTQEEQFVICRKVVASAGSQTAEEDIPIRRQVTPRHFTYLFDRAMDATYLLLDEYVFSGVSLVVMDGELMCTAAERPIPIIGFFDLFAYTPLHGDPSAAGVSLAASRERIVLLQRSTMSERYKLLREVIFHQDFHAIAEACRSTVMRMFCKRMYAVSEVMQLISQLSQGKCAVVSSREYLFHGGPFGPTRNDGLIFTPEAFDIISGSCETQLKWKYPSLLSADWLLEAKGQQQPGPADTPRRFRFCMYFKKRMRPGDPDLFGHTEFSRSLPLVVSSNEKFPLMPFVAECRFDASVGSWCFHKMRPDKKDANSVVTIISVLESQCEKITLHALLSLLDADLSAAPAESLIFADQQAPAAASEVQAEGGAADSMIERPLQPASPVTHFLVRATHEMSHGVALTLQFLVKLPDHRNALVCNHRRVSQCYGLGQPCPEEDPSSLLEQKVFIALANGGGSYAWSDMVCDAAFDVQRGRWVLLALRPHDDKNKAYCTRTIQYLMDYAKQQEFGNEPRPMEVTAVSERKHVAPTDQHYADRTKILATDIHRSNLRLHNNWIKSILIETAVSLAMADRYSGRQKTGDGAGGGGQQLSVLDLCCGRGGDLPKWRLHRLKRLVMVDSCIEAVGEAAARYCVTAGLSTKLTKEHDYYPGVSASFHVSDCFSSDLWTEVIEPELKKSPLETGKQQGFDIVSCQFSMHYAFNSEKRIRDFVSNVSKALAPGGIFVGTTVHDTEILRRRDAAIASAAAHGPSTVEFGNSVYRATFPVNDSTEPIGSPHGHSKHKLVGEAYTISVEESVSGAEEFIVPWKAFVHLCSENEYNLKLLEAENFELISKRFENTDLGQRVMSIVTASSSKRDRADSDGHISRRFAMTADEAETAKLFRGFLFQKV